MLLAAGADASLKSKGGTAREWAVRFGHTEAAEMLQEHEDAQQEAETAVEGAVALSHYQVEAASCRPSCSYGKAIPWNRNMQELQCMLEG